MARSFLLSSALFVLQATAQQASPFTDSKSGIKFSAFTHTTSGTRIGVALPENPTTDFIGQIVAPITNGGGWAGMSMASGMVGNTLVVAWPNEGEVISSFRKATGYTNPPVVSGDFTLKTIPDGTYVNDTAFSYTFLCSNCIGTDGMKLVEAGQGSNVLGWAMSNDALTDSTSASAALNYHSGGFGAFGMVLDDAKSADFDTWAALAVDSSSGSGGNTTTPGGNSTTPIGGGNSTAPDATTANSTYDYIVAGGGPAGIIAAQRLAESGASVLLLERGGASLASTGNTDTLSWNSSVTMYDVPGLGYYLSQAGKPAFCVDTADQAGCLLGGGTMVNAMMFVKPQKKDFDAKWPQGWKWDDVSAAADRVWERNPGQTYGSVDGVRYNDEAYGVLSQFFKGQGWAETDFIKDPNSKVDVFGHPPWNTADGLRSGPVRTYLPLAQQLKNFNLMLNTKVVRAVRNGSAITGVETETASGDRVIYNVNNGGAVILAAGTMSTPRILFNSGIGPAEQLQTVASGTSGVTLPPEADWIDLPVGAEIKDHIIFTLKFNTSSDMYSPSTDSFTAPNQTTVDLFAKGTGLLAQSGQRLNFWTSVNTTEGNEVFFQGTCNGPANNTVQMKVYLTHGATSSGSLGITADGATELTKDPWLQTDADIEAATMMMDRLLKMTSAPNSTIKYISSGANVTGADLIKNGKTGLHYVGTAKMGTKGDAGVVVDTDTKVYGTDNLFIVDASIHPDLPTGNTQAIVMVAAEAAAARILASNGGASSGNGTVPVTPEGTGVSSPSPIGTGISSPIGTGVPSVPEPSAPSAPAPPSETSPSTPSDAPSPSEPSSEPTTAQPWAQCGGTNYKGPTTCPQGWTCTSSDSNPWYSQCLQGEAAASKPASPVASPEPETASPAPVGSQYKRRTRAARRSVNAVGGRVPVSPGAFEDEESVWQRAKMERASFLDMY